MTTQNDGDDSTVDSKRHRLEPTDYDLRRQYLRLEKAFEAGLERDRADVEQCLQRERRFTVEWNRMSRNKIWSRNEGPECAFYDGTVEEFKEGQEIWPRGRNLNEISVYGQIWDFFKYMWGHTRPYKTVAMILLTSLMRPFQVAILGYMANRIEEDPQGVPLWLYFGPFYGYAGERLMYWWYEMWVPLNSQRVQFRCVLLTQRARLPDSHLLASKWPPGRFTGLLKDIDDVINGIWLSCLSMFDDVVSMIYLLILCFLNLAASFKTQEDASSYGTYVAVFLGLGIIIIFAPFLWFWFFHDKLQECETMIRDGQALYMSSSSDAVMTGSDKSFLFGNGIEASDATFQNRDRHEVVARKSYWVYGRTTFRSFFHRLAWTTNYGLLVNTMGPFVAYGLLTGEDFGGSFDTTNIIIVLLALKDLTKLSNKLLDYLIKMSRGCNVLRDVAELLNAKIDDDACKDLEKGIGGGTEFLNENGEEGEGLTEVEEDTLMKKEGSAVAGS